MKILIIGSGGHGRVVADILKAMPDMAPLGFISPDDDFVDALGVPRLGSEEDMGAVAHDGVVVAVGDNAVRARLFAAQVARGEKPVAVVHPSAVVGSDVTIEPGCMVCAGAVINCGARIRANTIVNTGATVDHDCEVGPHAHLAPGVHLAGDVAVGEAAFVGVGACVAPGLCIGDRAVVGAGAAVVSDIPDDAVAVGVPARPKEGAHAS